MGRGEGGIGLGLPTLGAKRTRMGEEKFSIHLLSIVHFQWSFPEIDQNFRLTSFPGIWERSFRSSRVVFCVRQGGVERERESKKEHELSP